MARTGSLPEQRFVFWNVDPLLGVPTGSSRPGGSPKPGGGRKGVVHAESASCLGSIKSLSDPELCIVASSKKNPKFDPFSDPEQVVGVTYPIT